jgi:hypothetical protein
MLLGSTKPTSQFKKVKTSNFIIRVLKTTTKMPTKIPYMPFTQSWVPAINVDEDFFILKKNLLKKFNIWI